MICVKNNSFLSPKHNLYATRMPSSISLAEKNSEKISKTGNENRIHWFASERSMRYLDGSLPGDFGFDPLGMFDPEGKGFAVSPSWLKYSEIIHARWAMLGVAGSLAPEILGSLGIIPAETAIPWFKSGVIPPAGSFNGYWTDP